MSKTKEHFFFFNGKGKYNLEFEGMCPKGCRSQKIIRRHTVKPEYQTPLVERQVKRLRQLFLSMKTELTKIDRVPALLIIK